MLIVRCDRPLSLEVEAVNEFYASVGYPHKISRGDKLVIAIDAAKVVGAVRLCNEGGAQVLRGMQVDSLLQGQGIGSRMLKTLEPFFGSECFCIPYERLTGFYAQARFRVAEPRDVPEFLLERYFEYLENNPDEKFVIMVR